MRVVGVFSYPISVIVYVHLHVEIFHLPHALFIVSAAARLGAQAAIRSSTLLLYIEYT